MKNLPIPIDPIQQIMAARNDVLTTIAHMQEFHGEDTKVIRVLANTVEALTLIQRWHMRNHYEIQNVMLKAADLKEGVNQ